MKKEKFVSLVNLQLSFPLDNPLSLGLVMMVMLLVMMLMMMMVMMMMMMMMMMMGSVSSSLEVPGLLASFYISVFLDFAR